MKITYIDKTNAAKPQNSTGANTNCSSVDISKNQSSQITDIPTTPAEMLGRSMLLDICSEDKYIQGVEIPDISNSEFDEKIKKLERSKWNNASKAINANLLNKNNIFLIESLVEEGYTNDFLMKQVLKFVQTKVDAKRLWALWNAIKNADVPPMEFWGIMQELNPHNYSFIIDMCNDNFVSKNNMVNSINRYDNKNIVMLKQKILEELKKDDSCKCNPCISGILYSVNEDSYDLIKLLVNDSDFPKEKIRDCVKSDEEEYSFDIREDIYNILKEDKVPSFVIASVLEATRFDNANFVKRICEDKIIPPSKIESAISGFVVPNTIEQAFSYTMYFEDIREHVYDVLLKHPEIRENPDVFADIISAIYPSNFSYAMKLLSEYKQKGISLNYLAPFISLSQNSKFIKSMNEDDVVSKIKYLEVIKQRMFENPEKYVNGEHSEFENVWNINNFLVGNYSKLFDLVNVFDKETIDVLMRKRLKTFGAYLSEFATLNNADSELLRDMIQSSNSSGKPFLPTQKIELINLLKAYNENKMSRANIYKMVESGVVDVSKLNEDLFYHIMKNAGMSDEEIALIPKEKLFAWDKRYIHLLSKSILDAEYKGEDKIYKDILRASNLHDFNAFINDESNIYGQTNAKTRQMFNELNLDYEKWINPSKDFETDISVKHKNNEMIGGIASQVEEDMSAFLQTPVKSYIKKHFPDFVKADKFVIPSDISKNKTRLVEFLRTLVSEDKSGKMFAVWDRAKTNYSTSNPLSEKYQIAQNTLTILGHLNQRLADLFDLSDLSEDKELNLKIKMWDRFPQKDLFQGNYSTCCIGLGEINDLAMPHYLMNTAFNMVEIVDNDTGDTVGNALCYFVKTDDGAPALVVDNIEIASYSKTSGKSEKLLRSAITNYLKKVAKSVTGRDDTPIFISNQYNDILIDDLKKIPHKCITFLGDVDCEKVYLDLFGKAAAWTLKKDLTQKCDVYLMN